jgi:hypothetical protein
MKFGVGRIIYWLILLPALLLAVWFFAHELHQAEGIMSHK